MSSLKSTLRDWNLSFSTEKISFNLYNAAHNSLNVEVDDVTSNTYNLNTNVWTTNPRDYHVKTERLMTEWKNSQAAIDNVVLPDNIKATDLESANNSDVWS